MKFQTRVLLLVGFVCCISLQLDAQFSEKAKWFAGSTFHQVNLRSGGILYQPTFQLWGLSAGMNYVLLQSKDVVSLGINANIHGSVRYSNQHGFSVLAQGPVFLLARLGANATRLNENKLGIGAGVGLNYSYLALRTTVVDTTGYVYQMRINNGFFNPTMVAEVGINFRGTSLLVRLHWSLLRHARDVRIGLNRYPLEFGTGGLGFMYSF